MPPFPTCKITVLKTLYHKDLAEEYRRPDVHKGPCPFFKVGDEFTVDYLAVRPKDFECDWAWDDFHKIIFSFMTNGHFNTWMKNKKHLHHMLHKWCETGGFQDRERRLAADFDSSTRPLVVNNTPPSMKMLGGY